MVGSPYLLVPVVDGKLTGDDREGMTVSLLDGLGQILSFGVVEDRPRSSITRV
jgi:hypothetical protein